jgi:hypothetical protein
MTKLALGGWIVKVTALTMSGGSSVEQWFAVGEPAKHAAELAVLSRPGIGNATVDARRMLAHGEIEKLQLKAGEVRAWS